MALNLGELSATLDLDASGFRRGADEAGEAADRAGRDMSGLADGSDEVASKGAQAAGALSGLGDLIGGKFGGAMQVAGIGMQAAADAGDLLNAAIEGGGKLVTKAAGFARALGRAETYAAGAKKASAVAQRILNAAMRANPLGLVITAVTLLVGGFILLYKKSSTFRHFVNGLWGDLKRFGGWIAGAFTKLIHNPGRALDWVKGRASAAFGWIKSHWKLLLAILTGPFGIAVHVIAKHWDQIRHGVSSAVGFVTGKLGDLVGFVRGLPGRIANGARGMWNGLTGGLKTALNAIIGLWNGIDFKIGFTVPDWVPGMGGKGWHSPDIFPDIPQLAEGGILTRPTIALAGEAGPEAVIPLSRLDSMLGRRQPQAAMPAKLELHLGDGLVTVMERVADGVYRANDNYAAGLAGMGY